MKELLDELFGDESRDPETPLIFVTAGSDAHRAVSDLLDKVTTASGRSVKSGESLLAVCQLPDGLPAILSYSICRTCSTAVALAMRRVMDFLTKTREGIELETPTGETIPACGIIPAEPHVIQCRTEEGGCLNVMTFKDRGNPDHDAYPEITGRVMARTIEMIELDVTLTRIREDTPCEEYDDPVPPSPAEAAARN